MRQLPFAPFDTKTDQFTKTGSGQTQGFSGNRGVFLQVDILPSLAEAATGKTVRPCAPGTTGFGESAQLCTEGLSWVRRKQMKKIFFFLFVPSLSG